MTVQKMAIVLIAQFFFIRLNAQTNVSNEINSWKPVPAKLPTRWSHSVNPGNVLTEYPRPQLIRNEWQNLNGLWDYAIVDSSTKTITAYQGQILVPFPLESSLSGVKKQLWPNQRLNYHRQFNTGKKQRNKRYLLHFGAVDFEAAVYVNNKLAGEHKGGYQSFSIDITNTLKEGDNDLMVSVLDPTDMGINPRGKQVLHPKGIMYTSCSGIWQTVWLEVVPQVFIKSLKLTPDIDKEQLQLSVAANTNIPEYTVEAYANGKRVTGSVNTVLQLPVPNPYLWSPDNPYLYGLSVRILHKGKIIDSVRSYFGMRKVEIKKDAKGIGRIYLNNQYMFHLGLLDQGYWPDGVYTAPTDDALKFDVEATKSMGFNTIRKHIKLEPDRWYYHCDKAGVLVWQDMPQPSYLGIESKTQFEKEAKENIDQLYNHPSIVCWVLFNEGWNRYDQVRLTKWMKETDPSRITNGHSGENYDKGAPKDVNRKWAEADLTDVHVYPGPGIAPKLPGKARVLGEWGGVKVPTPGHQWDSTTSWGYIETTPEAFAGKYEFMIKHLKVFEEEGLSASIFTQTTDVEIEENGLITYDREVFKIPVDQIRKMNERILKKSPYPVP